MDSGACRVRHLLILEDDHRLAHVLAEVMSGEADVVSRASTLSAAREILRDHAVDGILMDVVLADGRAESLLQEIQVRRPLPHVVALSGAADPAEAFRLAQSGVRAFIRKPVERDQLIGVWRDTLRSAPRLEPFVRSVVGRVPMMAIEDLVRDALVREALARANGSRRGAARLLSISRQLLQHIVRGRGLDDALVRSVTQSQSGSA
jgi:DNA-binding NtrC family response regulator